MTAHLFPNSFRHDDVRKIREQSDTSQFVQMNQRACVTVGADPLLTSPEAPRYVFAQKRFGEPGVMRVEISA